MRPEEAEVERLCACFERNGDPRPLDVCAWQYLQNPTGTVVVDFTMDGETVAAIYAVLPNDFLVGGRVVPGAQSIDTLVDAGYRRRGLFRTGAEAVYERLREYDTALVYGFPNDKSAPGFFGGLGWSSLDPVPFLVRPLRSRFLSDRVPGGRVISDRVDLSIPVVHPGTGVVDLDPDDERLGAVWQAFSRDVGVALHRSNEYVRWRLRRPDASYGLIGVESPSGDLDAYCAYRIADKHGGRIGYVMELLHRPGATGPGRSALAATLRRMAADHADAALAWSLPHSPNRGVYRRLGFVTMPERLRPIELHFGARPLSSDHGPMITNRSSWYLSYLDSDTV